MKLLQPKEIANLSDDELIILHAQIHAYFASLKAGTAKYNLEDLVNQHLFIFSAFQDRDLKHKVVDEIDEETMHLNKISISLSRNDSEEEELLMFSLSDEDFTKAMTSPNEWSAEEFATQPRGMPGIYLTPPHGRLIAEGKKTLIVKSIKFTKYTGTPIIVVSGKKAYGEIILKPPIEINLDEFVDLRSEHRITDNERDYWWQNKDKLYAYAFTVQKIYDLPINVTIPPGIQTFLRSVQIQKRISPLLQSSLDNLQDVVVIPDFISISGRTVIDEPSNDIDFIWRAKFDDDQLILQLREFLMKFTRSFPSELQNEFHHVDSPSGAAWHYKGITDLVLRFKDKPIVELEDDSYAYYKPIKKQADDTILFRVIGRMRKSQRFETLNLEEPKKTLEGNEALKLYQRLNKASQVWVLRCAIRDKRVPITIDLQKLVKESDLAVRWNADIAHPEWQGLDDPQLWEMLESYEHRVVGQHAYWSTFSKLFDAPPPLGSIVAIRPAKLLRFLGKDDNQVHYTWLWPSIIQIMSTEETPDNISDLDARHLIDEETEIMKPVKKKNEDDIACWVACFPKEKGWLNKLQERLGLPINDQSGSNGMHSTLAVFNSFDDIDKIRAIIANANIEKFVFEPVILDAFGDEAQVIILRGSTDERVHALANELRSLDSAIVDHEFNPHITLGETDKADNLIQDFVGIHIPFGEPVFMVSIPDKVEKRYSFSRCMQCEKPPEYDILWGNGKAHAWFCKDCLAKWLSNIEHSGAWNDVDGVKEVQDSKAASSFGDNTNANIRDRIKHELIKADKDFKIKLMEPFTPVKSMTGYREFEFQVGQENELYETWAKGYLSE